MAALCFTGEHSPLFEIALVLVRLDHAARVIVNDCEISRSRLRAGFRHTTADRMGAHRKSDQRWILAGEQFGLLTRIATTESVSSCELMKS